MGKKLVVVSLFDGISCGRLALHNLGIPDCCVDYYASEVDEKAIAVATHHFPSIVKLGDITKVKYYRHSQMLVGEFGEYHLPQVDLLIGGSPCQGFSHQGSKEKFEHSESRLIYEYERLRNEIRPTHMLLENVCGMTKVERDMITEMVGVDNSSKKSSAEADKPLYCHKLNSKGWSAQSRNRYYWTNMPFSPVPLYDAPTMHDVVKNYEGTYARLHGFTQSDATVNSKYYPELQKSHTLTKSFRVNNFVRTKECVKRGLTLEEGEQLQTLPIGYTLPAKTKKARSDCIGNCWTVRVIESILEETVMQIIFCDD